MSLIATALILATLGAPPVQAGPGEDQPQWIYRDPESDEGSVAVFLDWRYASVLFRVGCDAGQLIVRHYPKNGASAEPPMILFIDEASHPLATDVVIEDSDLVQIGRIAATSELSAALAAADQIAVEAAENEMGEPWYLGRAEALRRVAADCAVAAP